MADYKDTLNLPQTAFPMKANLPNREPERLQFWTDIKLYQQLQANAGERPLYILHDGPPYANGHTHLGHAVNKILKDIVVKSKTISGFYAPYIPGWDCHGLPIELNVEKKIGKAGVAVSPEKFRAASREYAQSQIDIQREEFKRMGVMGDWEHPYLTMQFSYEANIIRALAKIIANGHLVHGRKPVHWCVDCGSALAEAEVEYKNKKSHAIDVRFTVVDNVDVCQRFGHDTVEGEISAPIWTTTPWTLPANEAVAVNPKHSYVLVNTVKDGQTEFFILAEELLPSVMDRLEISEYQVLASCAGNQLENVQLQHPFIYKEVPIVIGDHVTLDAGTGNVHTAPAHGQDDYVVCSRYGLPVSNPVDNSGKFYSDIDEVGGMHVFKANETIIELLKKHRKLLHEAIVDHSYPHCWRHKTPLIFRSTPQWFISMDKQGLREQAITAINNVQWIPSWGQARIAEMIQNRPDWCISRQRVWGTPLPLFVHKQSSELHPDTLTLLDKIADKVEQGGVEAWDEITAEEMIGADAEDYEKMTDTLDVWFDAGVSHFSVLSQRLRFPADIYLEGSDQHRGWFQSSLLTAVAMYGEAPYKKVLTHGFTVDAKGHKMSKSIGNTIAPEKVINQLGADVLRLWVASTDYRAEMTASDEILKRNSDAYRRIRNTARFLLSNLNDFDVTTDQIDPDNLVALDYWAMGYARQVQDEIKAAYDQFQYHTVVQKIHHFCSHAMGSFYLDVLKDRLYTTQKTSLARRSAQTAMYHVLQALVRWMAPILSFTAEEIWQNMSAQKEASVFLTTWYEALPELDDKTNEQWQQVMHLRDEVNKVLEASRNAGDIGSALEAEITVYCNGEWSSRLASLKDELRFVMITSRAKYANIEERPANAIATEINDVWLSVTPSQQPKCARCWHRRDDVGSDSDHPELCGRCVTNVTGSGEERHYA